MCLALYYSHQGREQLVNFPVRATRLLIHTADQQTHHVLWGRRKDEEGRLPFGGWANLASIDAGVWDEYFPKYVQIPAVRFLERHVNGKTQWFQVTKGYWIQGIFIKHGWEQRVYVVTLALEELMEYQRWPRILSGDKNFSR